MSNNFQEYASNFSAIVKSEQIPKCQKEKLLRNMVKEIDIVFHEVLKRPDSCQEKAEICNLQTNIKNKLTKL